MLFEYTLHCAICSSPPTITWLLSNSLDYATFFMTKLLKNYQYLWLILSVQFSSVAQSCPTLCSPMDCSTPGFPVHHQLPELSQPQVHQISDAIQPSHPLSSPSSPAFSLVLDQCLFQWVGSLHQVAKVLELQLQYQSFQWIFRVDFLKAWSPFCTRNS